MMSRPLGVKSPYASCLVALFLLFSGLAVSSNAYAGNALSDYVNEPDAAYAYRLVKTIKSNGHAMHLINMDSQRWRSNGEVDRILWSHWMSIIIPDQVSTDTAMLIVVGGNNTRELPELSNESLKAAMLIAQATGSVVAMLGQVPNQPLVFQDSDKPLREDGLVAASWRKALDSGDFTWHAYLPMVKSVVRAMDTVQSFVPEHSAHKVNRFVVTGFSKRGAATWLTAAADARVRAIAPGVYDVLNFEPSMQHHFASYGRYAPTLDDYVHNRILERLKTPMGEALQKVIDPYHYVKQIRIPVFVINSAGDEFFPADSARFYVDDLPQDRLMRYIANTDHSLKEPGTGIAGAVAGLLAWYRTIIGPEKRPVIRWRQDDARLVVTTDQAPSSVRLWQASNTQARDFRLETTGRTWQASTLELHGKGEYRVAIPTPDKGWTAYFVELRYPGNQLQQTYTTQIFISPECYPKPRD